MRFEELVERWDKASLSHGGAATALGVGERTFRRWRLQDRLPKELALAGITTIDAAGPQPRCIQPVHPRGLPARA